MTSPFSARASARWGVVQVRFWENSPFRARRTTWRRARFGPTLRRLWRMAFKPLRLERAQPAALGGLATVKVARQLGYGHAIRREQVHLDSTPLAGFQGWFEAQFPEPPAGSELKIEEHGHGEWALGDEWDAIQQDSLYLYIFAYKFLFI